MGMEHLAKGQKLGHGPAQSSSEHHLRTALLCHGNSLAHPHDLSLGQRCFACVHACCICCCS